MPANRKETLIKTVAVLLEQTQREKETRERNDVEIQVIPIKCARFWGALKPVSAQGLVY